MRYLSRQLPNLVGTPDLVADKIRDLTMASASSDDTARVLDRARDGELVDPKNPMKIAMAVIGALVVAFGLCFLLEGLDTSIKTPQDVERYLGLPVVALIPAHPRTRRQLRDTRERQRRMLRLPPAHGHATGEA